MGERDRNAKHETKPRDGARTVRGREEGVEKNLVGRKGRRSNRMRGCKTTGDEVYRGKKKKENGVKMEIPIEVEKRIQR